MYQDMYDYLSYTAAGCAYREAARVYQKLGYNHEAATALVDAGNLSKDSDPQMATECFREASELFMELGRFVIAAKHLQTIGEINEAQGQSFYDQVTLCNIAGFFQTCPA